MKTKKDRSLLYIITTLAFVLSGIVLTSIINNRSSDNRTNASAKQGITATAVVADIKLDTNTLIVDQLVFTSSPTTSLGMWTVTPPQQVSLSSLSPGTTIQLVIDPATMTIPAHTLTAKELRKK